MGQSGTTAAQPPRCIFPAETSKLLGLQLTAMDSTQTEAAHSVPELSLFLPVLDEEENLGPMYEKIKAALDALGKSAEVIFVDDGSTTGLEIWKEIAARPSRPRYQPRRNTGQTPPCRWHRCGKWQHSLR